MVVRASKQRQQAALQRNWRIGLYGLLIAVCIAYIGWLISWHQQTVTRLDALQAKLAQPPVYIQLGSERLYAPAQSYSQPSHLWFMTNKSHPIVPRDFSPVDLVSLPMRAQPQLTGELATVRRDVAAALTQLDIAAKQDGVTLIINSAYRSYSMQAQLLAEVSSSFYDTGTRTAPAGASEHQLGLAVDFSTDTTGCRTASSCAIEASDAVWLATHAHKYGFILRYPEGKESITGYEYEPWHYRYVGRGLATALYNADMTLDEAWSALQKAEHELRQRGEI